MNNMNTEGMLNYRATPVQLPWTDKKSRNFKEFRSLVYQGSDKTTQEIIATLNPGALSLSLQDKQNPTIDYNDRFFCEMGLRGPIFLGIFENIINSNADNIAYVDHFFTRYFSAISETALKMSVSFQKEVGTIDDIGEWFYNKLDATFYNKFIENLQKFNIERDYNTICSEYTVFFDCSMEILLYSFERWKEMDFGVLGVRRSTPN